MLFHSHEYVFFFLPLVVIVYYALGRGLYSKIWLLVASLFFYGWWDISFIPLLVASIIGNYVVGRILIWRPSRIVLSLGIVANLLVIGHYKYFNFFLQTYADLLGTSFRPIHVILPLAISFYTFQQIAFLVDAYKRKIVHKEFINYAMFVTFFPHLICGPLLNHKVMMRQFSATHRKAIDYNEIAKGLFVFSIGLFKILVIAEPLSLIVNYGYGQTMNLSALEAWITGISFLLQLYFDFSAYSDMAIGSALMLGFTIPNNFNSPYRARNIIQAWQSWNITLGRFFRDYFYMPLCGKHPSEWRRNVMIVATFTLIGLWHGAAWTYVLFGLLNGFAMVVARLWGKSHIRLHFLLSWFLTLLFLLFVAILFRSHDFHQAFFIYHHMFDVLAHDSLVYTFPRMDLLPGMSFGNALWILPVAILVCAWRYNSLHLRESFKPTKPYLFATISLMFCAILKMSSAKAFIYFQF